ncbi:MAG: HAMP domain-containing protein [Chloroflexi bacterium]|nr:MAG: HAMP domain-containing protein [Chloroflexota bacterium]
MHRVRRALGSLRWRLTLTYVALLALLLAALGAFQYVALQRSLVSTRVADLRGDLQEAVRDLTGQNAVLPRRRPAPTPSPSPGGGTGTAAPPNPTAAEVRAVLLGERCNLVPAKVVAQVATFLANRTSLVSGQSVSIAIYDLSDSVIGNHIPTSLAALPRLDSPAVDGALSGHESAPRVLDNAGGAGELVIAFPVRPAAVKREVSVCLAAQLGTPTAPIDDVLRTDRNGLLLGGGAVLLLALLAGLWLTERTLGPLHRVTATAGKLAAGDLRARSRLPERHDEVGTLARAFDDMADRIEIAFAAQAASEARTRRFIADASHELRTPVTALKGFIDVLRRGVSRDPESLEAALSAMARESERMRMLVLDLLTLARIDAQPPQTPEPLDLNEVLGGVLDEGVPGMPETLERRFAAGPVIVTADRGSVVTVARNLLVNACKYAPGARQVWSTEAQDGLGGFTVLDEGPGIPAADLAHVFERFYRGEKTRAREEGGSGLGLSIVEGLVHSQGGEVRIESEETRWTRVTVRLPAG